MAAIGVETSKDLTYGILAPPKGVSSSKNLTYGILAPPKGVSISKDLTYVVLSSGPLAASVNYGYIG